MIMRSYIDFNIRSYSIALLVFFSSLVMLS